VLDPLLEIARSVREPATPIGREVRSRLARTSSLSLEGIELALTEHLEAHASEADREKLRKWCERDPKPPTCHVVLSAHVCTAALRAIALALMTARDSVVVKPSRRDPVLAEVLVRELASRGIAIRIAESIDARTGDEVHAYGSHAALDAIRSQLPGGVEMLEHGPGFGIAIVGANADLDEAAALLAKDVVPFDQRGCLSPRVALVEGPAFRGRAFTERLHENLSSLGLKIPRGSMDASERADIASFRATMQAVGDVLENRDCLVAFVEGLDRWMLPPAARLVLVTTFETLHLNQQGPWLTCVGTLDDRSESRAREALHPVSPRFCRLGAMQKPPLDGPVDARR
jgi:hypothetical protein